jgi:hypothetical protein
MPGKLRTALTTAVQQDRTARTSQAKTAVIKFIGGTPPLSPNDLTVADIDDDVIVLTDGEINLAVHDEGDVRYVTGKVGDWTDPLQRPLENVLDLAKAVGT